MKTVLVVALMGISIMSAAQRSSVSKNINDDGHTLSIQLDIEQPNRSVHYRRSFDVSGMSKAERKALEMHIIDSLEVDTPKTVYVSISEPVVSANTDNSRSVVVGGAVPYTKEVTENPEMGTLFMRYRYKKDGEDITFERTIKTRGKTEREKLKIIEATEQDLGLPHVQ